MTDIFSKAKRSEIMSRIRSSGTKMECALYKMVREILGPRPRIHRNMHKLPGRPDIVIPSLKLIIFADGCFYHVCPLHGHTPKSNATYWAPKLERNIKHDKRNRQQLRKMGYSVWRFWEHDFLTKNKEKTFLKLQKRLQSRLTDQRSPK
ncbi:MAG: very short patch repair endonuclease [Desulfomonile tiedjei]|nr:very short patch repair endonuclease [Desulfomonile tiedjei]